MPNRFSMLLGLVFTIPAFISPQAIAQYSFDEEPIRYNRTTATDRVARLAAKMDSGEIKLEANDQGDYIAAVLKELEIPTSSQALVFSKTSLQVHRISPETPRAIYFNDDVYVGWVQDGYMIEFAAMDDSLGGVFYSMRLDGRSPRLSRDRGGCIACHASQRTARVPGFFIRSVYPRLDGRTRETGTVTDHRSPLESRWGGWYVTGTHGDLRHIGNAFADDPEDSERIDRESGANLTSLSDRVDMHPYLTPHSDIVALMVMEHQMQTQNYITLANYEARKALASDQQAKLGDDKQAKRGDDKQAKRGDDKQAKRGDDQAIPSLSKASEERIAVAGEKLVEYLLFCEEPTLPSPVEGTSAFTEEFASRGPVDSKGRGLRQFDLQSRLFRYPCSYLIYSSSFNALPKPMATYVRDRVLSVLRGEDKSDRFSHLSVEDRSTILGILTETKPDWF